MDVASLSITGVNVVMAGISTTTEALKRLLGRPFDLILSDMDRDGCSDAGMELLRKLRLSGCPIPLIFYVGKVDPNRGVPVGAFGIKEPADVRPHRRRGWNLLYLTDKQQIEAEDDYRICVGAAANKRPNRLPRGWSTRSLFFMVAVPDRVIVPVPVGFDR